MGLDVNEGVQEMVGVQEGVQEMVGVQEEVNEMVQVLVAVTLGVCVSVGDTVLVTVVVGVGVNEVPKEGESEGVGEAEVEDVPLVEPVVVADPEKVKGNTAWARASRSRLLSHSESGPPQGMRIHCARRVHRAAKPCKAQGTNPGKGWRLQESHRCPETTGMEAAVSEGMAGEGKRAGSHDPIRKAGKLRQPLV